MSRPAAPARLALFDLDGTLTDLDTEREWALFLGEEDLLDPEPFHAFHRDYENGCLDIAAYYAWYLAIFERHAIPELERLRDRLVTERMLPSITERARSWIAEERERTDALLLVTASNAFLTEPIGAALGFDDVLATRLEREGDRFTGRIRGTPCLGPGKLAHLAAWLEARDTHLGQLDDVCFYSDSHNDLPLLEVVTRPIVVRPDPRLSAAARDRNWPVHP